MDILHLIETNLHDILVAVANLSIVVFEVIGVAILILAGGRGTYDYFTKNNQTKLRLAKGMAMGLEFKLGSEILRTVIVRDFEEILLVGAIIVLRAALTLLIHWEIKTEEDHMKLEHEALHREFEISHAHKEENKHDI